MAVHDIIIPLDPDPSREAGSVAVYALSVAERLGARLTTLAPSFSYLLSSVAGIQPPPQILEDMIRASEDAARDALAAFAVRAGSAGIEVGQEIVPTGPAGFADHFARRARTCDLAILPQSIDEGSSWRSMLIEAVLFDSGRPVIVVPYIQTGPARFDRILVAWDGSKEAARAIHDALPLLGSARSVEVLMVQADGREPGSGADPEALAAHLKRHGLPATGRSSMANGIEVADALLSHAADSGSDLIVMGGYAHSRLRHLVFGGATSGILKTMTTPVLMAH
ncbi:universal stress protein [Microvirga massiliensis]|uniref:universal stress protein n=1 Tax=Microvirga massiliensis TaxID=1033741 RepID=UPI00062BC9F0|nr:universal stress protein [Microvirga massiliensis]